MSSILHLALSELAGELPEVPRTGSLAERYLGASFKNCFNVACTPRFCLSQPARRPPHGHGASFSVKPTAQNKLRYGDKNQEPTNERRPDRHPTQRIADEEQGECGDQVAHEGPRASSRLTFAGYGSYFRHRLPHSSHGHGSDFSHFGPRD